jgi:hypothetical protein
MADDPVIPAVPATPAAPAAAPPAAVASPSAAVTTQAPVAPTTTESAAPAASSPVADGKNKPAEAAPEAKPEPAKAPELPKPPTSMLAEAAKEPAKPEGEKPAEAAKPEDAPAAPAFEAFTVPEGIKLGEKEVGQFTSMLGELEVATKGDHRLFQETGQKLLDMYIAERTRDATLQMENWIKTRQDWVKEIKDDPVLGRNRHETVLRDAARVRDMFATDRFKDMIEYTGAGDHPGMMDFVYNVARFLDKHGLLGEGRPVPAPPSRQPSGKAGPRSRYRASTQGA